jgi:phospholipid/cholesterol/gamma-HCH transport system substrate-binding protein
MITRRLLFGSLMAVAMTILSGCGFQGLASVQLPGGADVGSHPYRVIVNFEDVLDLVPQSAVKVNDVSVGRVESIDLDGWHAKVKLLVNGDVQLPANTYAQLRQTSLLGEKFVSLEKPTTETPTGTLGNGSVIELNRTGRNPEIEEVLGAISLLLNGGGLEQVRTITHELDTALDGRESDVRALLTQLDGFVSTLDTQRQRIVTAITQLDTLAGTLAKQKDVLANALDQIPPAIGVLADERTQLTSMLSSLNNLGTVAVQVINASSADTVSALKSLDPVLTQLSAAGSDLPNALELLATYPFPRSITTAVKGDYTNLYANLDLQLGDVLNNLLAPATAGTAIPGLPALPALPGLGG